MEFLDSSTGIPAGSWVYMVGGIFVMLSAVLPPVPSTTVFVGLGAVAGFDHGLSPLMLVLAMMGGAVAGDLLTYWGTRKVGGSRWGSTRGSRRKRAMDSAARRLKERPYMFMLTSRFIPLGRLSSNVAATVAGYQLKAFATYSVASAALWSVYSVGIGMLTQQWPNLSTQLAVVAAIVFSIVLGWLVGKISGWFLDRKQSSPAAQ
ncbi:DedA family protein [Specibacter sp. NPDC057265]|uniref:DedA family protein n=1 Tax=Specibacter sp. NPDC057265 TaxID=3346075 RepID=UPI003632BE15